MPDGTRWWRLELGLVRLVIAGIVFPVLVVALMQPMKLMLFGLTWVLPADTQWAQWVGWSSAIVGVVFAGYASLCVCRLIWPRASNGSHGDGV